MQAPLCEACYEILLQMNQFKKENCGPFSHLKPAIVQICTSAGGGAVIPTGGNTLCKLSAPSSVARPKLPGKGGGGLDTAAAGRKEPSWQRQQRRRPRPRPAHPVHAPTATRQNAHPRVCACAGVTLRLRAACGGRGGQKGNRGRKGRRGAARCGLGRVSVRPRAR